MKPRYRYQIRVRPIAHTIPGDETVLEAVPYVHVSYWGANPTLTACTPVDTDDDPLRVIYACENA